MFANNFHKTKSKAVLCIPDFQWHKSIHENGLLLWGQESARDNDLYVTHSTHAIAIAIAQLCPPQAFFSWKTSVCPSILHFPSDPSFIGV